MTLEISFDPLSDAHIYFEGKNYHLYVGSYYHGAFETEAAAQLALKQLTNAAQE